MSPAELLRLRLLHQQLRAPTCAEPADMPAHFGAMQAQDYAQSLWAVGVRLPGNPAPAVEQALTSGRLVRTWLLRGTLHLAAAADVRWLLTLLAPRLIAGSAAVYRARELDAETISRSLRVLEQALSGQPPQPRRALAAALQQAGIRTDEQRLYSLLHRAVLAQLISPAGRQGAEPTYALADDWLPPCVPFTGPEAVAELVRRYFQSHGPATLADFAGWAGLPLGLARQGLEAVRPGLVSVEAEGQTYWLPEPPAAEAPGPAAYLLPGFDEYLLAYKNRELLLDPARTRQVLTVNGIFRPIIVVDGRVVGTWRWAGERVELAPFGALPAQAAAPLAEAEQRLARFWQP
ncbi:winged helix DNA-binding domain-containing protein [Hymenobacter jeollabukensis]|uniref:Winged helix DNA-binding domain-containing protein n=1 Tax=Hymenobacter jeollabukensis TaxID=2025313 RepID=A0A5R8WYI7_9BACT|nr:winged helix DNA-binding domain-containing protein [Hymenobacter jeollabukensis]TLM97093.1 winged helix DNA-binding domain-containing protein [Hymenobacter jeollabukensis]